MSKTKALTMASLYQVVKSSDQKQKAIKADRTVLQVLIISYEAGRYVQLSNILQHELLPVPLSLAEMTGNLRTGNKAILQDVLTSDV